MRTFCEFLAEQDTRGRCAVAAYLLLTVLDDIANMLLGVAVIVIMQLPYAWAPRLAMMLLPLALYAAVRLLASDARYRVETRSFIHRYRHISDFGDLVMDTDYETLQSVDEQTRIDRASNAIFSAGNLGLEYQINEQLRLAAWLVTFTLSTIMLGLLNITTLVIVIGCNVVNMLLLAVQSRYSAKDRDTLADVRARRNRLIEQECDRGRCDDIACNRLLDWLLTKNGNDTVRIVRLLRRVEGGHAAVNAANGLIGFLCTMVVLMVAGTTANGMAAMPAIASIAGDTPYAALFLYVMLCLNMANVVQGVYGTIRNLRRNTPVMHDWCGYVDRRAAQMGHAARADRTVEAENKSDMQADGHTRFSTVVFHGIRYRPAPDAPDILHGIDLTYRFGQRIALVGENGAGKTTLSNVIAGLLKPTGGTITIDGRGVDYAHYQAFATAHIAILPQDDSLFSLTIADNVKLGMDADDTAVRAALRSVRLLDAVDALPHGIDTYLGTELDPDGTQLSGGQRRALLTARVLLHPQPVCILDEPTAAFDPVKEGEFYTLMASLAAGRTLIFVSHGIATTNFCDTAYVLSGGTVVQHGDPKRLIDEPGPYRDMFAGQREDDPAEATAIDDGKGDGHDDHRCQL